MKGGEVSTSLLSLQAEWLSPLRSRLYRRILLGKKRRILDLGCGTAVVSKELSGRCSGEVIALDSRLEPLLEAKKSLTDPDFNGAYPELMCARAETLPFASDSFDVVFSQCSLLWMNIKLVLPEISRVLVPSGVLIALEPDYGAMIEYPEDTSLAPLWLSAISRSGGHPTLARSLPTELQSLGFTLRIDLIPELKESSPARFSFLEELVLTLEEREQIELVKAEDSRLRSQGVPALSHLPFFIITAKKQ